jgi:hypothetical protein
VTDRSGGGYAPAGGTAMAKPTPITKLPADVIPVAPAREPQAPYPPPPATEGREAQPPRAPQPGQKGTQGVV